MLPENTLSTSPVPVELQKPVKRNPYNSYDFGGIDFNDPSQGLLSYLWEGNFNPIDNTLTLSNNVNTHTFFVGKIVSFSFTFDQNMQPFVVYENTEGEAYMRYYDSTVSGFKTELLAQGVKDVRCSLDDKRQENINNSDIIVAYIRNRNLYYRQQRDRYLNEYLLDENVDNLRDIGMLKNNRFAFLSYNDS